MTATDFESLPLDQLSTLTSHSEPDWVWSGYLARGEITLLDEQLETRQEHCYLVGLLRALGSGDPFLGWACTPTRRDGSFPRSRCRASGLSDSKRSPSVRTFA